MNRQEPASLYSLPTEILCQIWAHLASTSDFASLVLTGQRFAALFQDTLYHDNIQRCNSTALFWACKTGNLATAQRCLDAGASPDHRYFFPPEKLRAGWPPGVRKLVVRRTVGGTPLSVAAQFRQAEMVRLLLARGADPNLSDGRHAFEHHRVWSPMHWAVSCGRVQETGFSTSSLREAEPVPVDPDVVAALLGAGADPDAPTTRDPAIGDVATLERTRSSEPELPVHAAMCPHAPLRVLELLLDAGADASRGSMRFGCRGHLRRNRGTPLFGLYPQSAHSTELDDEKMLLLARRDAHLGSYTWKVDGDCAMLSRSSRQPDTPVPLVRLELVDALFGDRAENLEVSLSGIDLLFRIWAEHKRAYMEAAGGGDVADEKVRGQRRMLEVLQGIIAKVLRTDHIMYTDWGSEEHAGEVDLGDAFLRFCRSSYDDDIAPFAQLFEERLQGGSSRTGIQLSVSEAIERKSQLFREGKTNPHEKCINPRLARV